MSRRYNGRAVALAVRLVRRSNARSWQLQTPVVYRPALVEELKSAGYGKSSAYAAIRVAIDDGLLQVVPGLSRYVALSRGLTCLLDFVLESYDDSCPQ